MERRRGPHKMWDRNATGWEQPHTQELGAPRPGHGTVFVNVMGDGTWWGSWQDDYPPSRTGPKAGVEDFFGEPAEVVAWARTRPAARHHIFSPAAGDYVPMPLPDA